MRSYWAQPLVQPLSVHPAFEPVAARMPRAQRVPRRAAAAWPPHACAQERWVDQVPNPGVVPWRCLLRHRKRRMRRSPDGGHLRAQCPLAFRFSTHSPCRGRMRRGREGRTPISDFWMRTSARSTIGLGTPGGNRCAHDAQRGMRRDLSRRSPSFQIWNEPARSDRPAITTSFTETRQACSTR